MASGTLTVSATQLNAGDQVTLAIAITDFNSNAITLSADSDPGDSSGWQTVAVDASGAASVPVTLATAGSYTFTLIIDGAPAVDGSGNPVKAGPVTASAPATTTTAAPATTTTAAPATTTTAAPATTTTAAPATTTTAAPGTTTTAAPGTTTTAAPGTTTTAATSPTVSSVTVEVDPDDGAEHHPNSVQVSTAAKLKLVWSTTNATKTRIDPLGDREASGSAEIKAEDATFTLVALNDTGAESPPFILEVHTHAPGDVVSPHVEVGAGVAKIVSFQAQQANSPVESVAADSKVTLVAMVSDGCDSAKINGQDCPLQDAGSGLKSASLEVTADGTQARSSYTCVVAKDGADADQSSVTLSVQAATPATTTTAPGATTTAPVTTTTAPGTTTTAPRATTTAAPGTTTTASVRAISAFKASFAGRDGTVELSSRPGSFNDPGNQQEKKRTQQHFPAAGADLTFSWTVTGFEHAVVDVRINQLSALPKGEARPGTDFFTDLTKKGSGTVDYGWKLPAGRVTLWIDLSIFDPADLSKPIETRTVIAFTDSGLPAIDKLSIEAGTASQLFCSWSVVRAPASNVWLSIADQSGKAIGDPVQLRDVKANAATSGRTLLPVDPSKFPGQKLSFTAGIFMVADGAGKANAAPFDIASEGLLIGKPTTAVFASAAPAVTTTTTPATTTSIPPAGGPSHVVTVSLGNKTRLKPLVVADGKLKTSKVSFNFQLQKRVEDPSGGVPANPTPDPTSVEIAVLDPSGSPIKTETFTSGEQLQLGVHTWEWDGYSDAGLLDTQLLRRSGLSVQVKVKAPGVADSIGTLQLNNSPDGLLFTDVKIDSGANTVGVTVRFSAMRKPLPLTSVQVLESQVEDVRVAIEAGIANFWSRTITIDSVNFAVTSKTATAVDNAISVIVIPEMPPARSCNIGMFLPSFTGDGVLFMVEPTGTAARDRETGAHEIGHAIVAIRQGKAFSAEHKGTSTIGGDLTSAAVPYPATGEIDLMKYFRGAEPADLASRSRLIETDMKDLLEFTVVVFSSS